MPPIPPGGMPPPGADLLDSTSSMRRIIVAASVPELIAWVFTLRGSTTPSFHISTTLPVNTLRPAVLFPFSCWLLISTSMLWGQDLRSLQVFSGLLQALQRTWQLLTVPCLLMCLRIHEGAMQVLFLVSRRLLQVSHLLLQRPQREVHHVMRALLHRLRVQFRREGLLILLSDYDILLHMSSLRRQSSFLRQGLLFQGRNQLSLRLVRIFAPVAR